MQSVSSMSSSARHLWTTRICNYCVTHSLILASVFEHFRKGCFDTYMLDCCKFYTASNLTGSIFLKVCKPAMQFLIERDMWDVTESMIRGVLPSIYAKRLSKANNRYLETYDPIKESTFTLCIDANTLYGGIMEIYCLAICDFLWVAWPPCLTIHLPWRNTRSLAWPKPKANHEESTQV